jgi:hypothetical protein
MGSGLLNIRKLLTVVLSITLYTGGFSQVTGVYQKGITAEEGLKVLGALNPYTYGGLGFDNRYEGIKGSPRLSDTLLPSLLLIRGQEKYIELQADIDLVRNTLIYLHPRTRKLFVVTADRIEEIIMSKDGNNMVFRTTYGKAFEKKMEQQKFYQVLKDGPFQFIRMPFKIFVEADYRRAYSADRRYDEYQAASRYYLEGPDHVFHEIQLNRKSVLKLYPEKKKIIEAEPDEKSFPDKEALILSLLEKF